MLFILFTLQKITSMSREVKLVLIVSFGHMKTACWLQSCLLLDKVSLILFVVMLLVQCHKFTYMFITKLQFSLHIKMWWHNGPCNFLVHDQLMTIMLTICQMGIVWFWILEGKLLCLVITWENLISSKLNWWFQKFRWSEH